METELLWRVHALSHPVLDVLFLFSHALGTLPFLATLVIAMSYVHHRNGEGGAARLWLALGVSTYVLQELLKALFARPRPQLWSWGVEPVGLSFPSGHALAAATFYPLLAWSFSRRWPGARAAAWIVAVNLALFVGVGRLYLGVHWPSDVLAGWMLGAAQTVVALRGPKRGGAALLLAQRDRGKDAGRAAGGSVAREE